MDNPMSFNLNRVQIAGHLTRDPESRQIGPDRQVCNFGLAINRRFKGKDGELKEDTVFLDIEAWGRTAELVTQYLTKGAAAYIEGALKLDQWEDKDGQKRSKLKVVADSVQFLGTRPKGEDAVEPARAPVAAGAAGFDDPNSPPF
jgi:single-strand DNA-binding protein